MKEPDTNANYEPDELEETNADQDTGQESSSFTISKKSKHESFPIIRRLTGFEKLSAKKISLRSTVYTMAD